jgi:hypothetical protein
MDYFQTQKQRMLEMYGPQAVQHPHPGIIGPGLNPTQALASINPAFQNPQAYAHITREYSTPITIQEEPYAPQEPTQDMEIDT